jgi:hypothetical protein
VFSAKVIELKPPIFSSVQTNNSPEQYMHRARMFRAAAISLPDISNGEQFWPKYALLTHAIELALKAFAAHSVNSGKPLPKEPKQHDLAGWYRLAVQLRLPHDGGIEKNIHLLNSLH